MLLRLSEHPDRAYARIAQAFYPRAAARPGIAPSAVVDPTSRIDATAEIAPGVVIGEMAEIGARCRIAPNAVIGPGVVLRQDPDVGAHASLRHRTIGRPPPTHPRARAGPRGCGA